MWFPGFSADFFVAGDALVPVQRDILPRAGVESHWRIILSPGQVWSESGDSGWSRASFPFVLVGDDTNEAHNGLHTFVLAAAMQEFLVRQEGPQARLWDLMMREVYEPIGIRYFPMMHTRELDGSRDIPLMGIGLYPTVDDVAKISTLLQNRGRHQGMQLLSARGLDDALFKTGHGMPTGERSSAGMHLYSMSFWSLPRRAGRCFAQTPYMEGYGGNFVLLQANGVSAFRSPASAPAALAIVRTCNRAPAAVWRAPFATSRRAPSDAPIPRWPAARLRNVLAVAAP